MAELTPSDYLSPDFDVANLKVSSRVTTGYC
jgi:hypothetical protein